jgi:hypothetical protein
LLKPCAGQFNLQIGNLWGFTGPGSLVRVREFETQGTGLQFSDMDINTEQIPTLDLLYWFNRLDAIHFRFRYFNMGGSRFSSTPIAFNGAIIPGGGTNNFDPWECFSFSSTTSIGSLRSIAGTKAIGRRSFSTGIYASGWESSTPI